MNDALILHQYPLSPHSEKIRRILAWKRAPWKSVRAPAVMPKPDLVALTGGYRRIPVLQIGNHVYCDTALIARVIEERYPEPTLYPSPLAQSLAEWAEDRVFNASLSRASIYTLNRDVLVKGFTPDELSKIDDDHDAMHEDAAPMPFGRNLRSQFSIYVTRLERTFEQQPYLLGKSPCIADFSAYHPLWLLSRICPDALEDYPRVLDFVQRMAAIPDAPVSEITSEQAIELCKASDPKWQGPAPCDNRGGWFEGNIIAVRAADYGREPVYGWVHWASKEEMVVRRKDDRAGWVYVHFPRIGYDFDVI